MRRLLKDLWINLHHGVAFALFMRRGVWDFRIGIDQMLMLLLFFLGLDVALDYITHQPDPSFDHHAFAHFAVNLLLFTLSAYLIARLLRRREALLTIVLISYSASFLFALINNALVKFAEVIITFSDTLYLSLAYLVVVWSVLVVVRSALHACEARRRAVLVIVPVLFVVWALPVSTGGWDKSFWHANYAPQKDRYAAYRKMDGEGLFYAQPKMVEQTLQQLAPQRPGVSDLYFVSFGSYAMQDVFMKEVAYAQRTMDARFDTVGHSLELVNNLQTRDELPLATASNLRLVLNHLGERMESEEDVLMLYLSSHGSEQHELAVDFWPLPLNDITPESLRQMLDEAGIKWRVIVISACYSGGFIDAMRDEHTLVATASAKDRQSFGCGNEDDFTYYGEALFRDELGRGVPLITAFRQARESIHAREQREKLEHSLPQLFIGQQIEQKLETMHGPRLAECSGDSQVDLKRVAEPGATVECR